VTYDSIQRCNGALDSEVAEKMFAEIFKGRPVIMHATKGDLGAFRHLDLFLGASEIVDTQVLYSPGRGQQAA
jgi:hypothetical protein